MARLFGAEVSASDLARHVGDLSQVGGIRESVLQEGRARGVRALDVATGSGLAFTVLPDRCLDLCAATYLGASLCWHSQAGVVHPAYYEPAGNGWLWSFSGGLFTTCGLTQVGSADTDEGEQLGLHGRIANAPAEQVRWGQTWEGDELTLWIEGTVREARLFGPDLRLHRRISTRLGGLNVRVENEVENAGFARTPLMLLFHFNAGYPLLADGAELLMHSRDVQPRDEVAARGLADWSRFQNPQPGFAEQVFYHTPLAGPDGWTTAALVNRGFGGGRGLGLAVSWRPDELPHFSEWKMTGEGAYVVGMEPANCLVGGRHAEREAGRLQFIEPRERRRFTFEFQVLPDNRAIEDVAMRVGRSAQAGATGTAS